MKHLLPFILLALAAPAHAQLLGEVRSDNGRIELREEAGPCVGQARSAIFVGNNGLRVQGCWIPRPSMIFVVFLDGDVAQIPPQVIRKPTTL